MLSKLFKLSRPWRLFSLNYLPVLFFITDERRLRQAASTNNVDQVAALLDSGVNPNCIDEQRRSSLHLAACKGYCDIVRFGIVYSSLGSLLYIENNWCFSLHSFHWCVVPICSYNSSIRSSSSLYHFLPLLTSSRVFYFLIQHELFPFPFILFTHFTFTIAF
jgi:ankyrin repeat protein